MKKIGEPVTSNVANAWGRYHLQTRQTIEIELDDIGKEHPNHIGHGRAGVIFTHKHVGKQIIQYHYEGVTCWNFTTGVAP